MGLFDSVENVGGIIAGPMGGLIGAGVDAGLNSVNSNYQAQGAPVVAAPIAMPVSNDQIQSSMMNTQGGLSQQQQLIQALQAQNGIGNQSNVYNQLQGVANGTGPNPAQAMLANQTGQNVASQAALMAGQRGAGANAGLMARQIGQQGAAINQNAVGQAAALQAQQQMGALGQMGGMANQQAGQQIGAVGNYNQFAQGQQNALLGANAAQNNANVAMQSNVNNSNVGMQSNMNTTNAAIQESNAKAKSGIIGGVLNAGGAAAGMAYTGGEITKDGVRRPDGKPSLYSSHMSDIHMLYHGGALPMKMGGTVPGKAQVPGDSPKNDTVPAKLSPGEVVIPRSVMESDDPVSEASKFVAALMKKKGKSSKADQSDFKEALGRAIQGRKSK